MRDLLFRGARLLDPATAAEQQRVLFDARIPRTVAVLVAGVALAIAEDGTFTETVAFTDEESARRGESQEMPEDVRREMDALMQNAQFIDLHHPWFSSR